mmetsp:Transcript_20988/g.63164  ORF Transcript_20988/g.63164 Transcript_20988/m.63164 type:complete len:237 (+) Transcript_20988:148-858(+)|eukprot:CAMPEP_0206142214 /NCGR_PEP_ID=MMETSP1473-20131121/16032_1 /ASSEMBLY_ACC=CAM_ASM_001109 /TAXON_ID=1461547 /ORGANISM="Stichococcus sp, Strain RCC1054" /LENGTH=236 /DNA_ID=CAMNT_0053537125 /DNA_START=91 /DNA_END=801 /DNA_ORIENTATION=-
MKPVVYVDRMSQPSRAILIFCRAVGIDIEERTVKISKREQTKPEYLAISPLGKLPCLQEGEFVLPESAAILRYLAATHPVPSHWYPEDARGRARVDAALDWQHANVRGGAARLVFHSVLTRNMGGPFPSDKLLAKQALNTLKAALQAIETVWLAGRDYVAGDHVSLADLLMCCELEQLVMLEAADSEVPRIQQLLDPFPKVASWRRRVDGAVAPHYADISQILYIATERMAAKSKL